MEQRLLTELRACAGESVPGRLKLHLLWECCRCKLRAGMASSCLGQGASSAVQAFAQCI